MRVLGFPLHVRPGFLFFMVLIVALYRNEFGVWLAVSIAVFTLLHELGHAVAARRAGADAGISLDFLAGYTSYSSKKPMSRWTEAGIALAGPVTHIAAGFAVLFVMGVNPLVATERGETPASAAVWWAGVAIGAFNLIPVLPLDGGNVVTSLLETVAPGRARHFMMYASVAVTAGAAVAFAFSTELRGLVVFLGFLILMQLQAVFEERERTAVSIFDRGAAAVDAGDRDKAARIVSRGMRRPTRTALVPDVADERLRRLLAALPRPLPTRRPVARVRAHEPARARR